MRLIKLVGCFLSFVISSQSAFADINQYLDSLRTNPNALYAFFKEMPKGGELHYHLAGGAYPEVMLALAAKGNYCIDRKTFTVTKSEVCNGINVKDIQNQPDNYEKVIHSWSLKDFVPGEESSHRHFFNTFFKFTPLLADYRPQLLADIIRTAASQHELYLEIMILPDNARSTTFANLISHASSYEEKKNILLANKDFQDNVKFTIDESARIIKAARQDLGCDNNPKQTVCQIKVKFLYYILREQPIDNVYAQALNAFNAAAGSNDIVGINLVQEENGIISLRDYREHMKLIGYLHEVYPQIHISLHAGEISPMGVIPENLRFHIRDAIFTGKAERIGHGVSVAYEDEADKLVDYMAKNQLPVEINLISNREILNISGPEHPLAYYLLHKVPVAFSSDDEGVLRTDLTRQYVDAAFTHHLDYATIKNINRNALIYNFLPGKSIWADTRKYTLIPECQDLKSIACEQFIKDNEKGQLQRNLERQLFDFEKQFSHK